MGYRSQVVLAVHKNLMGKFLAHVGQCLEAKQLCFEHADEVRENYEGTGNFLFRWDGIKWYEGYEAIDCFTEFMQWCDGTEIDCAETSDHTVTGDEFYRFIRVGEESGDIVTAGHCEEFHIYPQTGIEY